MSKKKPNRAQLPGPVRMAQAGFRRVECWLTAEQFELIEKARAIEMRDRSPFVVYHAVQAAQKIVAKDPR